MIKNTARIDTIYPHLTLQNKQSESSLSFTLANLQFACQLTFFYAFNCQSKCNSYYAFTLARTTDPVLLQLLWHGPERPFHQHSYIRSAGFRTGRVSTSHCNRQLPLSVIFVYHGIVVTKKKDRIQTYHSRSCLSPHIEKISMLYRNHDTGLFGQFQAFSGLL